MQADQDLNEHELLANLEFDPAAVLDKESRVLLDPHFLGALHAQLESEFDGDVVARTLLQMGFLHGLQDASRVLAADARSRAAETGEVMVPPLAMHCTFGVDGTDARRLEVRGTWPNGAEAGARLSSVGAGKRPLCHLSAGYTSGWLSGMLDTRILALETQCAASGQSECDFVAREIEAWRALGDAAAEALIAALPVEAFEALVRQRIASDERMALPQEQPDPDREQGIDREAAAVHIWGPVMVIPYSGADEALRAMELIGSDPGAAEVSVVVVDFSGAILDEAFGAIALESIVTTADAWGAEVIFAEVPLLSETVVNGLQSAPLLVVKDLESAIARAFQIAESQRSLT